MALEIDKPHKEMTMKIGYDKPLYVLPFDHRATFSKTMFGSQGPLSQEQADQIGAVKQVIYDAFKAAVAGGVRKEYAGILVDETFGAPFCATRQSKASLRLAHGKKRPGRV